MSALGFARPALTFGPHRGHESVMVSWDFEMAARAAGEHIICGIDEAGRGPLAGPVCAAAVILPEGFQLQGLTDSKKLSEKRREAMFETLMAESTVLKSVAWCTASEIDEHNILRATHLAMRRAAEGLGVKLERALIDGLPVKDFPFQQTAIVKGDGKSISIAAASVLAKVSRDRRMVELDANYPEYGFARHKGYGTKIHKEALAVYGPSPEHRMSFAPCQSAIQGK